MVTRIGINGFGRIGRQVLRAINERYPDKLQVVAINDLADNQTNAHLLKYDSNYGIYPGEVSPTKTGIQVDGASIDVLSKRDPTDLPWDDLGVDVVIESTGIFDDYDKASSHLTAGAKKVIISAPAKGDVFTVVLGVNEDQYNPANDHVLSNASCTTNCLATMVKVLHDTFNVEHGLMSTIHSYTGDQQILDRSHSDMRRARSAAMNIIPTTTGAARAVGLVLPELNGKIHGLAYRVPTSTVSVTDFVATLSQEATAEDVNQAYSEASSGNLEGILSFTDEPLVSVDFKGNPHSSIIDGESTMAIAGKMVKVVGWYDNEWGYSCRTADLASYLTDKGF